MSSNAHMISNSRIPGDVPVVEYNAVTRTERRNMRRTKKRAAQWHQKLENAATQLATEDMSPAASFVETYASLLEMESRLAELEEFGLYLQEDM